MPLLFMEDPVLRLLSFGDVRANIIGLDNENRQIFRMFTTTLVLGTIGVAVALYMV